jgi:serum/glucocorticoid-regulated kinase 2
MVESKVSIDDFTLLSVVGEGAYGRVMQVRKKDTGEMLAIKMLRKDYIQRRNQILHTKTERNVLARVNHPFIVKLKYAFHNPKKLYFVLEYCPGGELFFHLSRTGRFDEPRARFYTACLVLAIEHLHEMNIVYRE